MCIYICIYMYVYPYVYINIYIYIWMYVCMYVYIYNTHTYMQLFNWVFLAVEGKTGNCWLSKFSDQRDDNLAKFDFGRQRKMEGTSGALNLNVFLAKLCIKF